MINNAYIISVSCIEFRKSLHDSMFALLTLNFKSLLALLSTITLFSGYIFVNVFSILFLILLINNEPIPIANKPIEIDKIEIIFLIFCVRLFSLKEKTFHSLSAFFRSLF